MRQLFSSIPGQVLDFMVVLRGLAAGCGAAELVGKKVVSGFCKVAEKAGKAAQTVWTVYDELNKAYGM